MGRGGPSPGADVGRGEPSPGTDVAGASPVPAQMWELRSAATVRHQQRLGGAQEAGELRRRAPVHRLDVCRAPLSKQKGAALSCAALRWVIRFGPRARAGGSFCEDCGRRSALAQTNAALGWERKGLTGGRDQKAGLAMLTCDRRESMPPAVCVKEREPLRSAGVSGGGWYTSASTKHARWSRAAGGQQRARIGPRRSPAPAGQARARSAGGSEPARHAPSEDTRRLRSCAAAHGEARRGGNARRLQGRLYAIVRRLQAVSKGL